MVPKALPLSDLLNRADELLDQLEDSKQPILVTKDGFGRAVIQDIESYNDLTESLAMLQLLLMGEKEIERGETIDAFEAIAEIRDSRRTMQSVLSTRISRPR